MFLVLFYSFWFHTNAASHGRCGARTGADRPAAAPPSDRCRRPLASPLVTRAHQYLTCPSSSSPTSPPFSSERTSSSSSSVTASSVVSSSSSAITYSGSLLSSREGEEAGTLLA
eukprot:1652192-Pleurochrysis_carterae.AAC.2